MFGEKHQQTYTGAVMKPAMVLDRDEINRQLPYAVIVENWDKVKSSGSKRRKYLAEFSESERKRLSDLYRKYFYNWYLRTGVPKTFTCRPETLELAQRAGNFFASV